MKIALDFGGVIDNDPESWIEIIKGLINNEHTVYILSHAHSGNDELRRVDLCDKSGAINISFSDIMDETLIEKRKAELVTEYNIDLFVDDYFNRCQAVREENPDIGIICIHYGQQELTQNLIRGLVNDT